MNEWTNKKVNKYFYIFVFDDKDVDDSNNNKRLINQIKSKYTILEILHVAKQSTLFCY